VRGGSRVHVPGVSRTLLRRGAVAVVVAGCAGALILGAGVMSPATEPDAAVDLADAQPYAVLAGGTVTGAPTAATAPPAPARAATDDGTHGDRRRSAPPGSAPPRPSERGVG
jgi:hypothetical protein